MALPAGVDTNTYVISAGTSSEGQAFSLEVLVEPFPATVLWAATGQPLVSFFRQERSLPNAAVVLELPVVDQAGFVDSATLTPVNTWYYKVIVRYLMDGRKVNRRTVKYIIPMSTDAEVQDFDLLPSGEIPLYQGPDGPRGKSAYEVAVDAGFTGTVGEWLESLRSDSVAQEILSAHIADDDPHPAYDDIPSLTLLFENGLV
jgi:hypothetical protein